MSAGVHLPSAWPSQKPYKRTHTPLSLSLFPPLSLSDKLFGKRLLQARHYIMSRKSWLKMVPTESCDILMTFPGVFGSSSSRKRQELLSVPSACGRWWESVLVLAMPGVDPLP